MNNHPQQSCKQRFLLLLLGFSATFLLGDQLLSRLRLPYIYGSRNGARAKCELYEQSLVKPDIVFLGCSYELCAINPAVIDAEASRSLRRPVRSLNMAASAAGAHTQAMMLRRMWEKGRLPSLVYVGVCPVASDSSQRWWFINGLRALGGMRDVAPAAAINNDVMWDALRTGLFASRFRWEESRIAVKRLLMGAPANPTSKLRVTGNGWGEWTGGPRELPSLPGDAPLAAVRGGINPGNAHAQPFIEWVRRLQDSGVLVRLIETPQSAAASDYDRADRNQAYRRWIDAVIAETKATLVQPPPDLMQATDFFGPNHMNPEGAARFSRWLASDVATAVATSETLRLRSAHVSNDQR